MIEILFKAEPFLLYGLIKGFVYALLGVGFCLVYKTTRVFHIAYGVIYTSAAYFMLFFIEKLKLDTLFSLFSALLLTCLIGLLTEKAVYLPLRIKKASSGIYLISSLGIYIIGVNTIALLFGNETKILNPGIEKTFSIHKTILTRIQIYQIVLSFLILIAFLYFLKRFKLGKMITALSNNPELFEIFGWSEKMVRSSIFILSSLFAGIASILVSFDVGMSPHVGMDALLIAAVAMIIGGINNIGGAAIAGICLGIIQNLVVWQTSARWEQAVTFCILILYLLIFREKLLGKMRLEEK